MTIARIGRIGVALIFAVMLMVPLGVPRVTAACDVTPYRTERPPDHLAGRNQSTFTTTWYGADRLWVGLSPAYQGVWYAGYLKVMWIRPTAGEMTMEGVRLDDPSRTLQRAFPAGDKPGTGFQPTNMEIPSAGCWRITARVDGEETSFVIQVHVARENPTRRTNLTPTAADWDALRRPLSLPTRSSGESCPSSPPRSIERFAGKVMGDGPVFLGGFNDDGSAAYDPTREEDGFYSLDLRWLADPTYTGPVLTRGEQIDGPGELWFAGPDDPVLEDRWYAGQLIMADWRMSGFADGLVTGPGCYAAQIDGEGFSEVIVFEVTAARPPSS